MKSKRMRQIENYLYENKTVSLYQLCDHFGVSMSTIRRDLNELLKNDNFKRVYGGITVVTESKELRPFQERHISNLDSKNAIAGRAAEFVEDGDVIFIDSGTTTFHMVDYLKGKKNVTVITNSMEVIVHAALLENIKLVVPAGEYMRNTLSFVGDTTIDSLQDFNINKCFMAATGISAKSGATNSSVLEYYVKQEVVKKSEDIYLLIDSSKFNTTALRTFCNIEDITYLVTDKEPPDDIKRKIIENNHTVVLTK